MQTKFLNDTAEFKIDGRLDAATAPALIKELSSLVGKLLTSIVFDFSELDYISSAGLRALIRYCS